MSNIPKNIFQIYHDKSLVKENVKNAISGDKKVGVFLSSGLDSVFILALYRCLCPNRRYQYENSESFKWISS